MLYPLSYGGLLGPSALERYQPTDRQPKRRGRTVGGR